MAIEKSLEPLVPAEMEIEIEIDPEEEEVEVEVEVKPVTFQENLAESLEPGVLDEISENTLSNIRTDLDSRKEWERTYADGIKLLGLKIEERTEPWDGACGVFHPVLSEAVVKFQSETIITTFPASGPVKTQIVGKIDVEKQEAANRVQESMNYELTEKCQSIVANMKDSMVFTDCWLCFQESVLTQVLIDRLQYSCQQKISLIFMERLI